MGFFDSLKPQVKTRQPQQQQPMTMEQARAQMQQGIKEMKANPVDFARRSRFNVPDGMSDANQILDYLQQTNQISRGMLQRAQMMAQRMGIRF